MNIQSKGESQCLNIQKEQCLVKRTKRKVEKRDLEVNWDQYFQSIRSVCPWSLQSFRQGRIDFVPFSWEGIQARDISWKKLTQPNFDAVVYQTLQNT